MQGYFSFTKSKAPQPRLAFISLIDYPLLKPSAYFPYELLKYKPIIFSFVDGLQYTDSVLYDLNMMDKLNCKVICVDDYNRLTNISQVPLAIEEFIKNNKNYDVVYQNDNKEIYLVRNEKN